MLCFFSFSYLFSSSKFQWDELKEPEENYYKRCLEKWDQKSDDDEEDNDGDEQENLFFV